MATQIEPKLFLRSGFAISCIGHMVILAIGLIFAGANPFDYVPADAITVEIVSPDEVGAGPDNSATAPAGGPEIAPSSEPAASASQPQATPPSTPQPAPPSTSQPTPPSTPQATTPPDQRTTRQASAPTQSAQSFVPWFQRPPEPPPAPPPPPAETHDLNPGDMFGMPLTLPGGAVGYEYEGEATEKPNIGDDIIGGFRKQLRTCSILPAGVGAEAKVTLRIQLNPDGTLMKSPENPHAVGNIYGATKGGGALFMAAMAAVRKCQPYKMLPPDQYEEWKTLDLTFTRENFGGG